MILLFLGLKDEEKNLFIYSWASYIPQDIIKDFEKETGIHVVYDVFESIEALDTQLTLQSGYDVVFPPAFPVFARGIRNNLFLALDYTKIPHAKELDPIILEKLKKADPHNQFGVPYLWGTTGIGYDHTAVSQRLKKPPPPTWGLLFDLSMVKRLAKGNIYLLDSPLDVLQAALLYLGYPPSTCDMNLWKKAIHLIVTIHPFIASFEGSKQVDNLVDGQSEILQGFSTYIYMASEKGKSVKKDIRYLIPQEGAIAWFDMMAIPKKAPHPHNAHIFINFILKPSIIARITNTICAANAVKTSYPFIHQKLRCDPFIFPDEKTMKRIYSDQLYEDDLLRSLLREWLKVKMGYHS